MPDFVRGSPLLEGAFGLAFAAHQGPRSRGDTSIDHPVAVAELLHREGFGEEVVAAALLHDVIEDTSTDLGELAERFGPEVCGLVREMTEDQGIDDYPLRKAEHRLRVARSGRVSAIYAADKLASVREIDDPQEVPRERLDHYQKSLETLSETYPDLPFLGDVREALEDLLARR
jgi:guanosine-3',5'-bis(diphosphate) 3'-pyrophosphohydrolase